MNPSREELQKIPIENVIAERRFLGIDANGDRRDLWVVIGTPYQISPTQAACPVALYGLGGRLQDAKSSGTFEALCLAIHGPKYLLRDYINRGGKIFLTYGDSEQQISIGLLFGDDFFKLADG
jgi:predicted NUDIX family NTP pyrophosphohydrolase